MLEIKLNQLVGDRTLYENTDLKINPGVTVLIGRNGTGKTYACYQIKEQHKHAYLIDIAKETTRNHTDFRDDKDIARWTLASERTKSV